MKKFLKRIIPAPILLFYHRLLALLAAVFYGFSSEQMIVIGVTGTNGKSTVVNLIVSVLEAAGFKVGATSSINFKVGDQVQVNDKKMTMLGRFQLQRILKKMVRSGCRYAVIETSSEGIKQSRHLGINYDVAVFTNLTPEHIESHGSFENYKKAKGDLFARLKKGRKKIINGAPVKKISVVNLDDEHAGYFLNFWADEKWGYSLISAQVSSNAIKTVTAEDIQLSNAGTHFKSGSTPFNLKLFGRFNVSNALAAIAVGLSQNIILAKIKSGLENVAGLPGRLELIDEGQNFTVMVDYAPEPASVASLYETLKLFPYHRLIHVLGSAGGGRDKARRPILGEMAARKAQIVIVTNEDPYDENPDAIIDQVAAGALSAGKVLGENLFKITDRRAAIAKALSLAEDNDLVLLTGKGCEQCIVSKNNVKIPWDERKVVREELGKLMREF